MLQHVNDFAKVRLMDHATLSEYLNHELTVRRIKNKHYSLRAFALSLGLSSSFLSKLIQGKKSVSEKTLLKIGTRTGLNAEQIEYYRTKLPTFRPDRLDFANLEQDHFQSIADWQHYAILEVVTLPDFEPNATWIAERLQISETKARNGFDRLLRLGLLKKNASGEIDRVTHNFTTTDFPTPTSACREHERQVLELAIEALDKVDVRERDQSSLTLAMPASRMKEAQKKIDQFRREMASLLQRRGKRDSVYHLSISLYPVTRPQIRKPKEKI